MFTENIYKTLSKYKKELEKKGYNVLYIGLFGSQNYNLSDEDSDTDAKAIVLPSLRDIIRRKVISKVYQFESGEVDVKDIITFNDVVRKGNPAYIEVMYTNYFIGDKELRELLGSYITNPMAVYGMAREKLAAIEKGLPASSPMIEKIGYDPKQFHHIVRLHDLVVESKNASSKVIFPINTYQDDGREFMLDIKRCGLGFNGVMSKDDVIAESKKLIDYIKSEVKEFDFKQVEIEDELLNLIEFFMSAEVFDGSHQVAARQVRTFGGNVPKVDKNMFKELEDKDGEDITYVVYSHLEVM